MKVLVDMNLAPRWIELLQHHQFEAIHWRDIGPVDAPDSDLLGYAATRGFVVLTQDLDFSAILAATRGLRPSVVQVRADNLDPASIGRQVVAALRRLESELAAGAIASVEPERTRIRLLPLEPT